MLFKKILDEEVFEIKESRKDVIEKMRMLKNDLRSSDSVGDNLMFFCNQNGKIKIKAYSFSNILFRRATFSIMRLYGAAGEVFSENGKTKIRIYHYFNYLYPIFLGLFLIWSFLDLVLSVVKNPFPGSVFYAIFGVVLIAVLATWLTLTQSHNKKKLWENTKKEMEERIEAIKRWND